LRGRKRRIIIIIIRNGAKTISIPNFVWETELHYLRTLPIKAVALVLKVSTYIITSFKACPMVLAAILSIISVLTFITAIILYVQ
jgi:hypothetical protein